MLSTVAVTLALAFLQPYTPIDPATGQHEPVCSAGVHVTYYPDQLGAVTAWTEIGHNPDCAFNANEALVGQRIEYQCAVIAHELGHRRLGLEDGAGGIMDDPTAAIPGACYPACRQAVAGQCARPSSPRGTRRPRKRSRTRAG